MNYYNENDPKAAAWLRELIKEGHISEGVVDERSILDVLPSDLQGYRQCHFFAGIGGWSYALRLAGVPDNEPVWTGSCPCQPFSNAGLQLGTADARHLWPIFFNLIRQCGPPTVFGEQVASKAGRAWLAGVFADLESVAYAAAGADLCAAGVRAPHIRQRLWWVADSVSKRRAGEHSLLWEGESRGGTKALSEIAGSSTVGGLANSNGRECRNRRIQPCGEHGQQQKNGFSDRMEHAASNGREQRRTESSGRGITSGCSIGRLDDPPIHGRQQSPEMLQKRSAQPSDPSYLGFWDSAQLIRCSDGKARRIEPGTFPLANGVSGRVGLLRGAGNAIVPQVAAEFISAFYEARQLIRNLVRHAQDV